MADTMERTKLGALEAQLDRTIELAVGDLLLEGSDTRVAHVHNLLAQRLRIMRAPMMRRRAERSARQRVA